MTSRDFRAIADIIAGLSEVGLDESDDGKPQHVQRYVAGRFADFLGGTNPRFDRERFLAAATGAPLTKGDKPRATDYAR